MLHWYNTGAKELQDAHQWDGNILHPRLSCDMSERPKRKGQVSPSPPWGLSPLVPEPRSLSCGAAQEGGFSWLTTAVWQQGSNEKFTDKKTSKLVLHFSWQPWAVLPTALLYDRITTVRIIQRYLQAEPNCTAGIGETVPLKCAFGWGRRGELLVSIFWAGWITYQKKIHIQKVMI